MSAFQKTMAALTAEKKQKEAANLLALEKKQSEQAEFKIRAQSGIEKINKSLQDEVTDICATGGTAYIHEQVFESHYVVSFYFSFSDRTHEKEDLPVFSITLRVDGKTSLSMFGEAKMSQSISQPTDMGRLNGLDLAAPSFAEDLATNLALFYKKAHEFAEQNR